MILDVVNCRELNSWTDIVVGVELNNSQNQNCDFYSLLRFWKIIDILNKFLHSETSLLLGCTCVLDDNCYIFRPDTIYSCQLQILSRRSYSELPNKTRVYIYQARAYIYQPRA